jgi:hypothetical protein
MPLTGTPSASSGLSGTVVPREHGYCIVGVDSTTIQGAINSLPAGGGTVFIPAGTYQISTPITVNISNVTLEGDGLGRTIIEPSSTFAPLTGALIEVAQTASLQYVTIRNLQLNCEANTVRVDLGILAGTNTTPGRPASNVEIAMVQVLNAGTYGIQFLAYAAGGSWNENVLIHDCVVNTTGTQAGLSLGGIVYGTIRANTLTNCEKVGIDPDGCTDLVIAGNHSYSNGGSGIFCEDTSALQPPARITIIGNICTGQTGSSGSGITVTSGAGSSAATEIAILGNICTANGSASSSGIVLEGVSGATVVGNVCNDNASVGITIDIGPGESPPLCSDVVVSGNRCGNESGGSTQHYGLWVNHDVTNLALAGNDFGGNQTGPFGFNGAVTAGTTGGSIIGNCAYQTGGSVSVGAGNTSCAVTLDVPQPGTSYGAIGIPNWSTTVFISSISGTSVTFSFGTAAPVGGGLLRYLIFS